MKHLGRVLHRIPPAVTGLAIALVIGCGMTPAFAQSGASDPSSVAGKKSPFMVIVRADAALDSAQRDELARLGCEAFVVRAEERTTFPAREGDRFLVDGVLDDPALVMEGAMFERIFDAYLATRDAAATERPNCLRREPKRSEIDARARVVRDHLRQAPLAILLPSGLSWTRGSDPLDLCYCEACVSAWRNELAARFGDAASAAQALGLRAATRFSEISPWTVDRVRARNEGRALPEAHLGPWLDYRQSLDRGLAERVSELAAAISPQRTPLIGWLGGEPTNPFGGHDWSRLGRAVSILMPPDDPTSREVVYSLGASGVAPLVLVDMRSAGGRDRFLRRRLIEQFFHGARGAFTPRASELVEPGSGKRTPFAENIAPILDWLDGAGAAEWVAATPERPRVGIVYSPRSVKIHWLIAAEPDGIYWPTRARGREGELLPMVGTWWGWQLLLHDLGIAYRYVPEQDLETSDGITDLDALILPRVISLSANAAARIEQFVAHDGLVLVDGECGMFDDLGNGRAHGALDALCGVERGLPPEFWDARAIASATQIGSEATPDPSAPAAAHLRELESNVSISAAHSTRALWLDLMLEDYVLERGSGEGAIAVLREQVAKFFAQRLPTSNVRIRRANGATPSLLRSFVARSDDATLLAVVRDDLLPEFTSGPSASTDDDVIDYVLELDETCSVQDLARAGSTAQTTKRLEFALPADGFALFSIRSP